MLVYQVACDPQATCIPRNITAFVNDDVVPKCPSVGHPCLGLELKLLFLDVGSLGGGAVLVTRCDVTYGVGPGQGR